MSDDVPAGADLHPGVVSEVAVVSERLWRVRFGSDPTLIGRAIRLGSSGQSFRVIGIVPADFPGIVGDELGLFASVLLTRSFNSLLFGIAPFDPVAFAVATAGVGVIAVGVCVVPALRAIQSDPAATLRAE
jgi:ABC-type lipoprotein release transport system permease subunit